MRGIMSTAHLLNFDLWHCEWQACDVAVLLTETTFLWTCVWLGKGVKVRAADLELPTQDSPGRGFLAVFCCAQKSVRLHAR